MSGSFVKASGSFARAFGSFLEGSQSFFLKAWKKDGWEKGARGIERRLQRERTERRMNKAMIGDHGTGGIEANKETEPRKNISVKQSVNPKP